MEITLRRKLPHYEDSEAQMEITIEPFASEERIEIEVKDGYQGKPNSRVTMSLEDFDRVADTVEAYRTAKQSVREMKDA